MSFTKHEESWLRRAIRAAEEHARRVEIINIYLVFVLDISPSMTDADIAAATKESDEIVAASGASERTYVTYATFDLGAGIIIQPTLLTHAPKASSFCLRGDGTSMFMPVGRLLTIFSEELVGSPSRVYFRVLSDGESIPDGQADCQAAAKIAQENGFICVALAYGNGLTKEQLAISLGFHVNAAISAEKGNPFAMVLARDAALKLIGELEAQTTTVWDPELR